MNCKQRIGERIYWTSVNDRRKQLFENIWPLPNGVSYNSYLIRDEKCALMDTVESGSDRSYADWVSESLDGRPLDYLIIHHMELDHSGEIENLVQRYPDVKIVGNCKTFRVLEAYFGKRDNLIEVKDGDTLSLGYHNLKFVFTPWVHWPETMMTFDQTDGVLFSGDAFGMFGALDGGVYDDQTDFAFYEDEMRRYYSNIVGKYSVQVIRALKKLEGLDIKMICPDHGPVWRENIGRIVGLYSDLSEQKTEDGVLIVYGSMYGNSEFVAESIARALADEGVRNIRIRDISKTHLSYLISETWNYKGIILGCPTYNVGLFPPMENLVEVLKKQKMKNHVLGTFTNYTWGGGAEKKFAEFAEAVKWETLPTTVDVMGLPGDEDFEKCRQMAREMAEALKK